jgi:hypothetical protein
MSDTLFDLGYQAGLVADDAPDAFTMSTRDPEWVLGFIQGFSEMQSFRHASIPAAGWQAGELGRRYAIPLKVLLARVRFEIDVTAEICSEYEQDDEDEDGVPLYPD